MDRSNRKRGDRLKKALLIAFVACWLAIAPVLGQSKSDLAAPVVIDGRQVLTVSSYESLSAADRAKQINRTLQEIVESHEKTAEIEIKTLNNSPVIFVNDLYLMTVTQKDVIEAETPEKQAEVWVQQLDLALKKAQKERSIQFLWRSSFMVTGMLTLTIASNLVLGWLWERLQKAATKFLESTEGPNKKRDRPWALKLFLDLTLLLARSTLWISLVLYLTNLFPFTRQLSFRIANSLRTSLLSDVVPIGKNQYSVVNLLILIGLFLGLIIFSSTATNLLRSRVLRVTGINLGVQEAIAIVSKYTIITVGAIVLLQIWGVELSSLAILASALGIGVGFGLQNIARNFGSGLVLIFERPIQVGDFVEVGQYTGVVERIGARSTEIKTLDRVSIIVPNSRFLESEVINWSHQNPISRIHIPVGVAYHSDPNLVRQVLLEAAQNCPGVLSFPQADVWFKGFGDSALEFELLVWIKSPSKQLPLTSDLYFSIFALFAANQIEIPFPQRDLHLRGDISSPQHQALLEFIKKTDKQSQSGQPR
ncbi:MAG: mechanosensitive ion channel family protein [Prochloraceae cyanobacterium]